MFRPPRSVDKQAMSDRGFDAKETLGLMAGAWIDTLLTRFGALGGGELVLESGAPVRITNGGGRKDVTTRSLSGQEILGVITPIAPADALQRVAVSSPFDFGYAVAGVGEFRVAVTGTSDALAVSIVPAAATSSTTAATGFSKKTDAAPAAPTAAVAPAAPSASSEASAPVAPAASAPATAQPVPVHTGPAPIDELFRSMVAQKASDLHLCVGMPPLIRKDGSIQPLQADGTPLDATSIVILLDPIMPEKNRGEFARRRDTDFAYEIAGLGRFRANVFMDRKGRGAVFRVIPSKILTAEDLGLSQAILQLCRLNKGLVLVTGPTGSGKSTTLCAMVDYINRTRDDHIITIEDPIEFVHENKKCLINQREVHTHTDSFKDALRAALREDPDILLVGEMRDLETVAIAIETAETGHLVFGTLHTTTAASTVDRVIDQFPTDRQAQIRIMLSESLKGVIAQTLCKKIGGGRVAALEVLIATGAVSNLIREGKTFQLPSMMQVGKAQGMVSLNDALMELVTKKLVEPQEAYTKAVDKANFETSLKRAGIDTKFVTTG
jgi:twitching motility protein PilT